MITAIWVAGTLVGMGRVEESAALAQRAARHPAWELARPLDELRRAYVDAPAGRHQEALPRLAAVARQLERADPAGHLAILRAGCGVLELERGDDDAALEWFARALLAAEDAGQGSLASIMHASCSLVHARAGRVVHSEVALARADALAPPVGPSHIVELARATLASYAGRPGEASLAAERALERGAGVSLSDLVWLTTGLAPVLADAGRSQQARALIDTALAAVDGAFPDRAGAYYRAWLMFQRSWLRGQDGDEGGALEDIVRAWRELEAPRSHLLWREWSRLEPWIWRALERGRLDPGPTIAELHRACPDASRLHGFARHPVPAVRAAMAEPLARSGHPEARARLGDLREEPDARVAAAAERATRKIRGVPLPLRFQTLGRFEVHRGDWPVATAAWGRPVAARLVRLLLVQRDSSVPEDMLFAALWPDLPTASARRGLQVALSLARAVLDEPLADVSLVHVAERTYRLSLRPLDEVDCDAFEAAASVALEAAGPERQVLLERAAEAWGGDPLPEDRYAEWSFAWRERLVDRYLAVLAALRDGCFIAGDYRGAVRAGRRLVELDPLDEHAHRKLMLAYARAGRRGHALRQYIECRQALVELGIEPTEESAHLQSRILVGEAV